MQYFSLELNLNKGIRQGFSGTECLPFLDGVHRRKSLLAVGSIDKGQPELVKNDGNGTQALRKRRFGHNGAVQRDELEQGANIEALVLF